MSVVLLGYRGSGKTTLGRALAERLGRPLIDTDERIVAKAGDSIKTIFETQGETAFRNLEAQALAEALGAEDAIISIGGGAVLRAENRALLMTAGERIYLRCDPVVLAQRIHADPGTAANRPALTHLGGTVEEIISLLEVREPLYREVATAELDVTDLSAEQALALTLELLDRDD